MRSGAVLRPPLMILIYLVYYITDDANQGIMFANACEKAMKFTHPCVVSTRTVDGTLKSSVATYFFISKSGWVITAAHVFSQLQKFNYDREHIKEVNEKRQAADAAHMPCSMTMDPKWITNHSIWWGFDGIRESQIHLFLDADLAAVKLENVPPQFLQEVAVFGNPDELRIGTSLCRIGFPFVDLEPKFENNNFILDQGVRNLVPFPLDGIFTRGLLMKVNDQITIKQIETSSPGLKGQSGGPLFDTNGTVMGMQVRTQHMPLGFAPHIKDNGVDYVEHQFINTGVALHASVIMQKLISKGVPFETVSKGADGASYIIN